MTNPAVAQYMRAVAAKPGLTFLFRTDDVYEAFGPTAEKVGAVLDLPIEWADDLVDGQTVASVIFDVDAAAVKKLVEQGLHVAVCEQVI